MQTSKGSAQHQQQPAASTTPPPAPSKGSQLHLWGACKPCAFFIKDGCANGDDCHFCHLCEPGEKKRRKKERLAIRKEMREKMYSNGDKRFRQQRWMQ
jgi:hypothetical protein